MIVPSGYGKPVLDYDGSIAGRAFAIETKALGKNLSPRQEATIVEMLVGGVTVFVIDDDEGCALLDRWLAIQAKKRTA